jgi:hypothetical protein
MLLLEMLFTKVPLKMFAFDFERLDEISRQGNHRENRGGQRRET